MATNQIQIFNSPQFGQIRTAGTSEQPLFCLADVCKALELRQGDVRQRLTEGVVSTQPLETAGGIQQANFVNEDGLYDVILDSRKPEAKQFRKWVTSEVLPSIRKTGGYIASKADDTPEEIMARALLVAQDTIKRKDERLKQLTAQSEQQQARIEADAPRVRFSQAVETSGKSILIGELAKILRQNGVEIGERRLFEWLRKNGYLCSQGERYNQPTQRAMELGLFEIKKTTINKPDGTTLVSTTTKVTGKGQIYFVDKFLRNAN